MLNFNLKNNILKRFCFCSFLLSSFAFAQVIAPTMPEMPTMPSFEAPQTPQRNQNQKQDNSASKKMTTDLNSVLNDKSTSQTVQQLEKLVDKIEKNDANSNAKTDAPPVVVQKSPLLRMNVNNIDLLNNQNFLLTNIVFSEKTSDDDFLFTGDVKYLFRQNTSTVTKIETFYFLFKKISAESYEVAINVANADEKSLFYDLIQSSPIEARQTGNLIVLRLYSQGRTFDVLIDANRIN